MNGALQAVLKNPPINTKNQNIKVSAFIFILILPDTSAVEVYSKSKRCTSLL